MITLVDSNVLLDLVTNDPVWSDWSAKALARAANAAFLAGKAFFAYKRKGGQRSAPLADFFIGAHAAVAGLQLLTRDPRRYRTYFPTVRLIAPG